MKVKQSSHSERKKKASQNGKGGESLTVESISVDNVWGRDGGAAGRGNRWWTHTHNTQV